MGKHKKKSGHRHYEHHKKNDYIFWLIFIIVFLFVVGWIIFVLASPRITDGDDDDDDTVIIFKKRESCDTGENFDTTMNICKPSMYPFDTNYIVHTKTPCEISLSRYVCGNGTLSQDRLMTYAKRRNRWLLEQIITKSEPTSPLSIFYSSCMATRDPKETEIEIGHLMERVVDTFRSYSDLPAALGTLAKYGYTTPFDFNGTTLKMNTEFTRIGVPLVTNVYNLAQYFTRLPSVYMMDRIRRVIKVQVELDAHASSQSPPVVVSFPRLPEWEWMVFFDALYPIPYRSPIAIECFSFLEWFVKNGARSLEINDWKAYLEFSILYNTQNFIPDFRPDINMGRIQNSNELDCFGITEYALPAHVAAKIQQQTIPSEITLYTQNVQNLEPFVSELNPHRYEHNLNLARRYRVQQRALSYRPLSDTQVTTLAFTQPPITDPTVYMEVDQRAIWAAAFNLKQFVNQESQRSLMVYTQQTCREDESIEKEHIKSAFSC